LNQQEPKVKEESQDKKKQKKKKKPLTEKGRGLAENITRTSRNKRGESNQLTVRPFKASAENTIRWFGGQP